MKLNKLYIQDFTCYEHAYIDFTKFSAALIVGIKENSDMVSNGVGKTTIFRAIEYVLFNQSDTPLERLIRDDTNLCQVVLDFSIGDQEYRLARSRTKKGSSDLTLLQRNSQNDDLEEAYHSIKNNLETPFIDKKYIKKYWKDLSGSRAGDTEKDLAKLIKINYKSFISTVIFPQNDMTGLPTATPEKRKGILKEALNLLVYAKLEKIAKEKSSLISKDIDKYNILISNLGDPDKELIELKNQLTLITQSIFDKNQLLSDSCLEQSLINDKINEMNNIHSVLESNFANLITKEKLVISDRNKTETSVKEYQSKKTNVSKLARSLMDEIKELKDLQSKLIEIDFSQIDILSEKISILKDEIAVNNAIVKTNIEKYEELKIPLPSGSSCKNCRKPMSDKDRAEHKSHIANDMEVCQNDIKAAKKLIVELNTTISNSQQQINSLQLSKQQLENVNISISSKNKEILDKKSLHNDYCDLFTKFSDELKEKNEELLLIQEELSKSSLEEDKKLLSKITDEKKKLSSIIDNSNLINKDIANLTSNRAIIEYSINQKNNDKLKKEELANLILELDFKLKTYPSVIQAFSSTGIPNLIIQNVLDDLQVETNNLLAQLKPGLQLSFFVEKTKGDGDQTDTLDINYHLNGRDRYYKQLSGGYQLAVAFALKLGLSFLLQKMIGTDVRFLLLDEMDQSLDKASVDAFVEIIKFFQKDLTILIITHNDRLKDKFAHAILVEQDINMVSKARVVSY